MRKFNGPRLVIVHQICCQLVGELINRHERLSDTKMAVAIIYMEFRVFRAAHGVSVVSNEQD